MSVGECSGRSGRLHLRRDVARHVSTDENNVDPTACEHGLSVCDRDGQHIPQCVTRLCRLSAFEHAIAGIEHQHSRFRSERLSQAREGVADDESIYTSYKTRTKSTMLTQSSAALRARLRTRPNNSSILPPLRDSTRSHRPPRPRRDIPRQARAARTIPHR